MSSFVQFWKTPLLQKQAKFYITESFVVLLPITIFLLLIGQKASLRL